MKSPNGLTTIFFDLDGTLRFNKPAGREFFIDHAVARGHSVTPAIRAHVWRWEHLYWATSAELRADLQRFGGETKEFWIHYSARQLKELGYSADEAATLAPEFSRHMNDNYKPENQIDPTTPGLLAALHAAGYTLGVLSNRDKPFAEELEKHGLKEYFAYAIPAGEAQVYKPDPAIFDYIVNKAGVSHAEMVYIGDNYYADILGARNAGMKQVLLDIGGIFDEPGCPAIKSLTELPAVLEHL
jgi:putative hydrolase of the HAD superfamily